MLSKNIEDYKDIGLNADWCVSVYNLKDNLYIFDNEDDTFSFCLAECVDEEWIVNDFFTGTFPECIDFYEENEEEFMTNEG